MLAFSRGCLLLQCEADCSYFSEQDPLMRAPKVDNCLQQ